MNKNTVIGLLILIIIIGLGYYISTKDKVMVDNTTVLPVITEEGTTPTPTSTVATPAAPIVVTNSNANTSSSTAAVTGTVKPNGAATTYWYEYGETTALGTRSTSQAIGSGYYVTPTPAFITGLKANTLYYYRLSAQNKFGTVNGTTYTFQTNMTSPPQAKAPSTRTNAAGDIARTSATINGQVNPNGTDTSYWYEYGTDNSFGSVTGYRATNSGTTFMSVPMSLTGLEPLTKYYFRLNAQNQYGTVNGTTMNFTTSGPAQSSKPSVETLNASSISSSDAVFNGRINPNDAQTTYWFEYSTDSLLGNLIGSGTPKRTLSGMDTQEVEINVNNLSSNTKYYYRLVGMNDHGTVYGKTVSFTTKR